MQSLKVRYWAQWLMPIIPALWEAKAGAEHLRSGVQDHSGQYDETLSLQKNTKKKNLGVVAHACSPSYLGGWGRRITLAWEVEVAVSWDHATSLQPGQQNETLAQKNYITHIKEWMIIYWSDGSEHTTQIKKKIMLICLNGGCNTYEKWLPPGCWPDWSFIIVGTDHECGGIQSWTRHRLAS